MHLSCHSAADPLPRPPARKAGRQGHHKMAIFTLSKMQNVTANKQGAKKKDIYERDL